MPVVELIRQFIEDANSQILLIESEIPNIPPSETKSLILLLALERMYIANIDKLRLALKETVSRAIIEPGPPHVVPESS
jgi:hypothetical protein